MTIKTLSNSSMDRFNSCPLSFYHRYLNPEKPTQEGTQDFYAEYGTLVHWMAEFYPRTNFYRHLPRKADIESGKEDINSYLASYGNRVMEREGGLTLEQMLAIYDQLFPMIKFPKEDVRADYYEQGKDFIQRIVTEMDWSQVPGLEQEFRIDLGNGLPPIIGFIDKLEKDENGYIVTDYKSSKVYTQAAILKKNQLPLYGMAVWFLTGEFPYKYRYHFTRFNKMVEVEVPVERLTQAKNAILFTHAKMAAYEREGKFPAQFSSFYCNNFCGYSRLCETYQTFNPSQEGAPDEGNGTV